MRPRATPLATLSVLLAAVVSSAAAAAETPIPRSRADGASRHVLLESKRHGDVVEALHKRVRAGSTFFTRSEIDCRKRKMRIVGQGELSPARIQGKPTEWFEPIPGSSNADLAQFVCKWPAAQAKPGVSDARR